MLSFDELVKEMTPPPREFLEFDGMNCNDYLELGQDECRGWDGVSRRCDCGNHRVGWENMDGQPWPVAY